MPRQQTHLSKIDRRYFKFKMKRIKRAEKRGNRAESQRHATELSQHFGFDNNSEPPIEPIIDIANPDMSDTNKLKQLRGESTEGDG